jgi:hypothetical protein
MGDRSCDRRLKSCFVNNFSFSFIHLFICPLSGDRSTRSLQSGSTLLRTWQWLAKFFSWSYSHHSYSSCFVFLEYIHDAMQSTMKSKLECLVVFDKPSLSTRSRHDGVPNACPIAYCSQPLLLFQLMLYAHYTLMSDKCWLIIKGMNFFLTKYTTGILTLPVTGHSIQPTPFGWRRRWIFALLVCWIDDY